MTLKNHKLLKLELKVFRAADKLINFIRNYLHDENEADIYKLYHNDLKSESRLYETFKKIDTGFITNYTLPPKSLIYLYQLLYKNKYSTILECGSGASSIAIALAMKSYSNQKNVEAITLESDSSWIDKTLESVKLAGYEGCVQITYAPIESFRTSHGEFSSYSPKVVKQSLSGKKIDLLLIDGPGPEVGRKGVIPLLKNYLSDDALILVDDAARDREHEYINYWKNNDLAELICFLPIGNGMALMKNI